MKKTNPQIKYRIIAILLTNCFGLHWIYLNQNNKGLRYILYFLIGSLLTPLGLLHPPLFICGIIVFVPIMMSFVDFIWLLKMPDEKFDYYYNFVDENVDKNSKTKSQHRTSPKVINTIQDQIKTTSDTIYKIIYKVLDNCEESYTFITNFGFITITKTPTDIQFKLTNLYKYSTCTDVNWDKKMKYVIKRYALNKNIPINF